MIHWTGMSATSSLTFDIYHQHSIGIERRKYVSTVVGRLTCLVEIEKENVSSTEKAGQRVE